jgi:hypothetical protein
MGGMFMTDDVKELLQLQLSILKTHMKENGVLFGILVNKQDVNNSQICFVDKKKYVASGQVDGIKISLAELNEGL